MSFTVSDKIGGLSGREMDSFFAEPWDARIATAIMAPPSHVGNITNDAKARFPLPRDERQADNRRAMSD
jgi:hypothetical protein